MANIDIFQRNSEDKWISWDENGGLPRFERYSIYEPPVAKKMPKQTDGPRFEYRGLMIDVGRNLFPTRNDGRIDFFMELIDVMTPFFIGGSKLLYKVCPRK